jgi:hypothetical protein
MILIFNENSGELELTCVVRSNRARTWNRENCAQDSKWKGASIEQKSRQVAANGACGPALANVLFQTLTIKYY